MSWSKEEGQDQLTMQQAVEAAIRRGPTGPLPAIGEVNRGRQKAGLEPVSQAQYDAEVARRAKSAMQEPT